MNISNINLKFLVETLYKEELNGFMSRARTKFIKFASTQLSYVEEERKNILEKYCEKNDDGSKLQIKYDDGSIGYKIKDVDSYNKEIYELLEEVFVIDETNEREEMLKAVRDILFNTAQTFSNDSAIIYDEICESLEEIYKLSGE